MTVDTETFRRAAGSFASGVTVITSAAGGNERGMTASAVCSLSLDPTLMLVCIDKKASTLSLIRASGLFNINVLSAEQRPLAGALASKTLPRETLIREHTAARSEDGVPILGDCAAYLECRLVKELDGGDHVILVGEVLAAQANVEHTPLLYFRGLYGEFAPMLAEQPRTATGIQGCTASLRKAVEDS